MQVTTIGLDLAKNVFQVHGVTEVGEIVFNRSLRRAQMHRFFESLPPCLVGIEACGTSHYWAREIATLGHEVRLIPPAYVKPYVKRGKSDAIDAAAICEAVTRPSMRFVAIKTPDQQAVLALHRVRDLIVRQRTQIVNMLRGVLAEFGIVVRQGAGHAIAFAKHCFEGVEQDLPDPARDIVTNLSHQLVALHRRVLWYGRQLNRAAPLDARVARLRTIPGVGPITASAIVASIGDGRQFSNGRSLAAWLGLTPLNRSSGGKERLGRISKMGDRYIRRLLVLGMTSRIKQIRHRPDQFDPWFSEILERKPAKLAAVAMANKTARIIRAVLTREQDYKVRTA
ncbi:IS110 family transposase [Ruegeria arenilitoris]|uniref:IS110 family transposase n=1 Tax=Ruegeria arenilitoris TaxID=1173585 RepID=UPI0014811D7B|nr:IS110 family transposase [Ruegeria arenilitoris]